MRPTDTRISQLADMFIMHLIDGRSAKALAIAQYLRRVTGWYVDSSLNYAGYRVKGQV